MKIHFTKEHEFFIGIDSDGCVFDTMEIKQKECFCPTFIEKFELQAISRYARQTWEFVNLYSSSRGCNRFKAIIRTMDLLRKRESVKKRGIDPPAMEHLKNWVNEETQLGNPALKKRLESDSSSELERVYDYSTTSNTVIKRVVHHIPPFPWVNESLKSFASFADCLVVSQTPYEALAREWEEHGIDTLVQAIAGQEMGTKEQHIRIAASGKYADDKILMIGDAPGDLHAAKANGALFFPITPGSEEQSWERLFSEGIDKLKNGTFRGVYQEQLTAEFLKELPEQPQWEDMVL